MTLQFQVPSRELCERLKELRYKQEGVFWWVKTTAGQKWEVLPIPISSMANGNIVAPTIAELLEAMPTEVEKDGHLYFLTVEKIRDGYYGVHYSKIQQDDKHALIASLGESLANVLSECLVYLAQQGLIKLSVK